MNDNKSKQRRKILLGVAGGAAVPAIWSKPLVKSVVLPAHAATSPMPVRMAVTYFGTNLTRTITSNTGETADKTLFAEALDAIVPPANAQSGSPRDFAVTVEDEMAEVSFRNGPNTEEFSGMLSTDGSFGEVSWSDGCNARNGTRNARVVNYTTGDPDITIEVSSGEGTWQVTVPEGPILPFSPFATCMQSELQ